MISVRFLKNQNNIVFMEAKGHAEFDEYGKDIVCSAVSVLAIAVSNGITEVLHFKPMVSVNEDGFLSINIKNLPSDQIKACQVLMETLLLGLKGIENNYGEYIKVEVEEV
ncbi:ribosomal-processing cysteine protease Prp [Clostridium thailandense]|uniref:ribosomal-processing cysteine protease Prp n=1 Tax=Clostridium thailandense TaxID=2794346 RepID=UPI00398A2816